MIQSRTAAADTVGSAYLGTIYIIFKYLLISLLAGKILFFFYPCFWRICFKFIHVFESLVDCPKRLSDYLIAIWLVEIN